MILNFYIKFLKIIKISIFSISLLLFMFYSKYILNYNNKSLYHKYNNFVCNKIFNIKITLKSKIPKLTKPHIIMVNHYNITDSIIIKKILGLHLYTICKSDLVTSENTVEVMLKKKY